ncbi:hypothetical protein J2X68_006109 [Streptomyces sp. 3330]|uniref:hypothetical protein n=1 Tax=Streptomyces sp. 3330 TaxID=2817755 RepID=UPI002859B64D|nr:hypothetical protein [Streptomyces sp. 3330]MDR6979373.1 hypothetical protein [Streptomyces sp. 3330]
MTSSMLRGRPRRATSHISVRVAHAVLGGAVGVVWLVLPVMTSGGDAPVAIKNPAPGASAAAADDDEKSTVDLVLPLVAVGAAGALAGYGYLRRVRRTRARTTPGGAGSPPPRSSSPLAALDEEACAALVEADDRVRAARTELGFAGEPRAPEDLETFRRAVRAAEGELTAAFRMRQRYDEGVPKEEAAREHALAGILGRCAEAGRRLDSVAGEFGRLRGLEQGLGEALGVAESRFRELAGRAGASAAVLAGLRERYAPTATASVTGSVEQAKDRLLFATVRLNRARQSADSGQPERAARHLRAAEGAIAQAAVFVEGVDRLAAELRTAEQTVPAALTGAEAELAWARGRTDPAARRRPAPVPASPPPDAPDPVAQAAAAGTTVGGFQARLLHVDAVLGSVRQELTGGQPRDPVGVLRRVLRATAPVASGRAGVLPAAALITARSATAAAADFVATHRGAVGATARTRLAEAERLLATGDPADRPPADVLALEARELAERDVRAHGNPYVDAVDAEETAGTGGAVLGGIVPAEDPEDGTPAGFAGPARPAPARRGPA